MALCSAQLAPVRQSARRLGARSRDSAAEAPDALIRRLGREILHHVPVATRVSELGQQVGVRCSSVRACTPSYASRISYSRSGTDAPDHERARLVAEIAAGLPIS